MREVRILKEVVLDQLTSKTVCNLFVNTGKDKRSVRTGVIWSGDKG